MFTRILTKKNLFLVVSVRNFVPQSCFGSMHMLCKDIGMSQVSFSNIIMIKLDGFLRIIHKYIGRAMSFEKKMCEAIAEDYFFFQTHAQSIQFHIKIGGREVCEKDVLPEEENFSCQPKETSKIQDLAVAPAG